MSYKAIWLFRQCFREGSSWHFTPALSTGYNYGASVLLHCHIIISPRMRFKISSCKNNFSKQGCFNLCLRTGMGRLGSPAHSNDYSTNLLRSAHCLILPSLPFWSKCKYEKKWSKVAIKKLRLCGWCFKVNRFSLKKDLDRIAVFLFTKNSDSTAGDMGAIFSG